MAQAQVAKKMKVDEWLEDIGNGQDPPKKKKQVSISEYYKRKKAQPRTPKSPAPKKAKPKTDMWGREDPSIVFRTKAEGVPPEYRDYRDRDEFKYSADTDDEVELDGVSADFLDDLDALHNARDARMEDVQVQYLAVKSLLKEIRAGRKPDGWDASWPFHWQPDFKKKDDQDEACASLVHAMLWMKCGYSGFR